ncbi:hypothetical protein [Caldimonas brevitalea]|uniref:Uncharacterized protein n=1 Tax=Caldimonas brevitalea TaxID=413882 RepID=A0A0G3BRQ8_9BURK|nr:hypothetical protein [Caldimonas brevitalea]AKJ30668.1 hypothetical protein AAW51_3977 [Caldimonas brevitalea]
MTTTNKTRYTRRPAILFYNGRSLHVEQITPALEFTRKPACDEDFDKPGLLATAYITKTVHVADTVWEELVGDRDKRFNFLRGEGGHLGTGHTADAFLCVELVTPTYGRLLINPEGGDTPLYVASID